jgi:hypothetical protein
LGIHTLGYKYTAVFPHVTRAELEAMCIGLDESVEGGGAPELSLNGELILGPIHHKSIVRYIPDGTAHVYGTLPGFRAKPRSHVCATPLQEEMLQHFETETFFQRPCHRASGKRRASATSQLKPVKVPSGTDFGA